MAVIDVPGQQRRYSLLIGGRKREEFVDWPANWTKAPDDAANASQRAEFEHERDYFDKNKDVRPYNEDNFGQKVWYHISRLAIRLFNI